MSYSYNRPFAESILEDVRLGGYSLRIEAMMVTPHDAWLSLIVTGSRHDDVWHNTVDFNRKGQRETFI